MTSQSITRYVNVSVSLEGSSPQPAGFGYPALIVEHAIDANRNAGPFTSTDDLIDYGFLTTDAVYDWASAIFSQEPHPAKIYVVRRDAGDADDGVAFAAAVAENPALWYAIMSESRDSDDILALAAAVQASTFPKIHIAQSSEASLLSGQGPTYQAVFGGTPADGTYRLIFTGFGLGSPVNVDTVRAAGSPASNALLGPAQRTALTTALGGSLAGVLAPGSIGGSGATTTFRLLDGLPTGTITVTDPETPDGLVVTLTDADVGSRLFALQYQRTALVYHPTDAEFLDGAWAALGLSFNLDVKKGAWAYLTPVGIAGTSLSSAQIAALAAINVNWFAPAVATSGVPIAAFTAQGWVSYGSADAGMRIDERISLDWSKARYEEALVGVLLRAAPLGGVPYTDDGINQFDAAVSGVNSVGVAAGHFLGDFPVPAGSPDQGVVTPAVFVPTLRSLTSPVRASRTLTFRSLVYLRQSIERVIFNVEVRR